MGIDCKMDFHFYTEVLRESLILVGDELHGDYGGFQHYNEQHTRLLQRKLFTFK